MKISEPNPVPADWNAILAESEAELAAGQIVDGVQLIRELYAAAEQLELSLHKTEGQHAPNR